MISLDTIVSQESSISLVEFPTLYRRKLHLKRRENGALPILGQLLLNFFFPPDLFMFFFTD